MYDAICKAALRMYRAGLINDWECRRIVIDAYNL